ncbi:unnamed protein product [Effrenium voratum]|uniref:Uncharacterized protein n=1 Tax=Effrenium voratum TaxID=2562239 RepID=A0AA36NKA8_9DINO|nr:unnamed protein product [Effrenium voratum]
MVVIAASAALATLAGAATAAELTRLLDALGLRKWKSRIQEAEMVYQCPPAAEARILESARTGVQECNALWTWSGVTVSFQVGWPLQLCFENTAGALGFSTEIKSRATFKSQIIQLSQAMEDWQRQMGRSQSASASSLDSQKPDLGQPPSLRARLAVPKGVPMFNLTPQASGIVTPVTRDDFSRETSGGSTGDEQPGQKGRSKPPKREKDKVEEAARKLRSWTEDANAAPSPARDPNSFASQVLMGLGLQAAKSTLVAEKRVDVLKTRFEKSKGSNHSSSLPTLALPPMDSDARRCLASSD